MPFEAAEVARQIEQSRASAQAEATAKRDAVELAVATYRAATEPSWAMRLQFPSTRRWWAAMPVTGLADLQERAPAELDYCVVAADASYIAPDRHRGARSYLINVGGVMLRYGENYHAELRSVPTHYAGAATPEEETTGKALEAQAALHEIRELHTLAERYGADVVLLDGSLMQVNLVLSRDERVQALMAEYYGVLEDFRRLGVPIIGYISRTRATMVMRAVRMLACEGKVPCEDRPTAPCSCSPLWQIDDADLFWALLDANHSSPVFEPFYSYPAADVAKGMRFTYLVAELEVARLEFPAWVYDEGRLDHVLAIVQNQCVLGRGYPNALTLAHQWAVLHNGDREAYYYLLEKAGLLTGMSQKAFGKRMIGQAV